MKTQSGEASEETNTSPLYNSEEEFQEIENVEYNLGTCVGPQLFQEHVNNNAPDELDRCLQKGLACATIIGNELEDQSKLIGSWTDFCRKVAPLNRQKVYLSIYKQ